MEESTTNRVSPGSVGVKFGIIMSLASIVLSLVVAVMGGNPYEGRLDWSTLVGVILGLAVIYFAHKDFKERGDGYMSYGQGLLIGVIVGAVSMAITILYTYIYLEFVDPAMLVMIQEKAMEDMEKRGMDDAAIEQGMAFVMPMFWIVLALGTIFMTFVYSLIVGIFTRNPNPEADFN